MRILIIILLSILIAIFSCERKFKKNINIKNSLTQIKKDSIKDITFIETNISVPANFDIHKSNIISITKDSCSLIEFEYKKGKFNSKKILKSFKTSPKYNNIINELSSSIIKNDISSNHKKRFRESAFTATFLFNNGNKIVRYMEYKKTKNPEIFYNLYDMYFEIKHELYE